MAGIKDRLKKKQQKKGELNNANKPDVSGIYDESDLDIKEGEKILKMPISEIYSEPQVRTKFPEDKILIIGNSMLNNGQFSPVVVFPEDPKGYKIHQGECRYRGAKAVGLEFVDVVIRKSGDVFTQIAENIHRIKLDPFDISKSLNEVKDEKDLTAKQLADALEYSEAKIKKLLPLSAAPDFIKDAFDSGELSGGIDSINYLIKIAKLDTPHAKVMIAKKATREQLSNALKAIKSSNKPAVKTLDDNEVKTLVTETSDAGTMNALVAEMLDTSATKTVEAPVTNTTTTETVETVEAHVTETTQSAASGNIEIAVSASESVVNVLFDDGQGQGQQEGYILLGRKADAGNIVIVLRDEVGEHEVEASSVQVVGYGKT